MPALQRLDGQASLGFAQEAIDLFFSKTLFLGGDAAHVLCCCDKAHRRDLYNKVRSTLSRQADILVIVHPGHRVKLKGFENPNLPSARVNNLLRNDTYGSM
ncbi:MAG: hypothetical protein ACOH1Q_07395 [Thiobacillus sp.]